MAEKKSLSDTPPRGALAEGADRFDRIARSARSLPGGSTAPSPYNDNPQMLPISPDEMWARNYMSHGIGPKAETSALAGLAPVAHLVSMPKFLPPEDLMREAVVAKTAPIVEERIVPKDVAPSGPIGSRIGKPVRKRSWLGRVLLGRA